MRIVFTGMTSPPRRICNSPYSPGKLGDADAAARANRGSAAGRTRRNEADSLRALHGLALVLAASGRLAEAELYFAEALRGFREMSSSSGGGAVAAASPELLAAMRNFASLLTDLGKLKEAEAAANESLTVHRRELGDKAKDTLAAVYGMAKLRKKQGALLVFLGQMWVRPPLRSRRRRPPQGRIVFDAETHAA